MLRWKGRQFSATCACCTEPLAAPGISRRRVLAGGAALGLAATGFAPTALAQAKPHRIDVHCHVVPPTWLAAMDVIGRKDFPLSNWSVQNSRGSPSEVLGRWSTRAPTAWRTPRSTTK